jgi:hypothetical protein
LRLENTNTGATSVGSTLTVTCCGVYSSGVSSGERRINSLSSGVTAPAVNTTDTVLYGIRLRPDLRNISVQAIEYDFLTTAGTTNFHYRLLLRPTLTGATWANDSDTIQKLTNAPTFTGGIVVEQGHMTFQTSGRIRFSVPVRNDVYLGYSIANVPDSLIMVGRAISSAGNTLYNFYYREVY